MLIREILHQGMIRKHTTLGLDTRILRYGGHIRKICTTEADKRLLENRADKEYCTRD
jgi:hypothetical protein